MCVSELLEHTMKNTYNLLDRPRIDVGLKVCVIIILVLQICTFSKMLLLPSDTQRRQKIPCVRIECVGM